MTDIGSLLRTSVIVFFYHADGADSTGLITVLGKQNSRAFQDLFKDLKNKQKLLSTTKETAVHVRQLDLFRFSSTC